MRSTGCGLRGRPLNWQSSTAHAWCVISAGRGSFRPRGVVAGALPGRRAAPACALPGRDGGAALLTDLADVGLLPAEDGTLPARTLVDLIPRTEMHIATSAI